MHAPISQDKPSLARRLSGALLAIAVLVGPASAAADLIGPAEEACQNKAAGDACAEPAGAAGTCVASEALGGRQRLRCVVGANAPTAAKTATPQAADAKTPAPTPSAATASVAEKKGCSVSAAGSSNEGAPLGITVALAALALCRAKRRARPAG
ncbi:hypothetical protein [Polyangium mundeleinium]|uniref:MYXO-CTERM domain-containing protein n=1 Tax=Polyangium mundeleinium TaxID=2995306 RepID=A0ABT5ELJ3_9BACT|nr:hypothetical protein [Polyangium mundeleinium]MDC0741566.1 hypothetical protein [Polyangium mundeleinium]